MVRQINVCKCGKEDWECDIGFEKDPFTEKCMSIDKTWSPQPPSNCDDYYLIKTGYRKVAGNVCESGLDLGPHHMVCPETHRKGMIYLTGSLLIILLIVLKNRNRIKQNLEKRKFLEVGSRAFTDLEHDKIQ